MGAIATVVVCVSVACLQSTNSTSRSGAITTVNAIVNGTQFNLSLNLFSSCGANVTVNDDISGKQLASVNYTGPLTVGPFTALASRPGQITYQISAGQLCPGGFSNIITPLYALVPGVPSPPLLTVSGDGDGFVLNATTSVFSVEYDGDPLIGCVLSWGPSPYNASAVLPANLYGGSVDPTLPATSNFVYYGSAQSHSLRFSGASSLQLTAGVPYDFSFACYNALGSSFTRTQYAYAAQTAAPTAPVINDIVLADGTNDTVLYVNYTTPVYSGRGGYYSNYLNQASAHVGLCNFTVTDGSNAVIGTAQTSHPTTATQYLQAVPADQPLLPEGTLTVAVQCYTNVSSALVSATYTQGARATPRVFFASDIAGVVTSFTTDYPNATIGRTRTIVEQETIYAAVSNLGTNCQVTFTDAVTTTSYGSCTTDFSGSGACNGGQGGAFTSPSAGSFLQLTASWSCNSGLQVYTLTSDAYTVVPAVPSQPPPMNVSGYSGVGTTTPFSIVATASRYSSGYATGIVGCVLVYDLSGTGRGVRGASHAAGAGERLAAGQLRGVVLPHRRRQHLAAHRDADEPQRVAALAGNAIRLLPVLLQQRRPLSAARSAQLCGGGVGPSGPFRPHPDPDRLVDGVDQRRHPAVRRRRRRLLLR